MIQRVLGAKNMYHARMGIVFATHLKMLIPIIVVIPGLILFAENPEILMLPESEMRPAADRGYVHMIQALIPIGLRGLFLAALFGAIQSTINSVINSTSTVFTLDIYQKYLKKDLSGEQIVKIGMIVSIIVLIIAILMGGYISDMKGSLFIYIQTLYAFFAPPFSAIFLFGLFSKRVNGFGAVITICVGFILGILLKLYVSYVPNHALWLEPYLVQSVITWAVCAVVLITTSRLRPAPPPEKISNDLTFNFKKINIFTDLGDKWYKHVLLWWGLFVIMVLFLLYFFSPLNFS
jgi:SSS family solute:Na+ symporter